ncbi:hypothetical protein [Leptospira idonii]|uniref:Uncharacterized protein n=1 Tax=Leptospira idonii TaxID=1193500 RepID=A0A4R9M0R1_9LEPT|nr:hypothetical protein [Leptospira idonii]TGN20263.1 hypothetical protein EHS15_04830 [Leptospira idonii]
MINQSRQLGYDFTLTFSTALVEYCNLRKWTKSRLTIGEWTSHFEVENIEKQILFEVMYDAHDSTHNGYFTQNNERLILINLFKENKHCKSEKEYFKKGENYFKCLAQYYFENMTIIGKGLGSFF